MFSYGIPLESKAGNFTKYTGKYPAQVIDVADPDDRGRVRVICPHVYHNGESHWAEGCFPPGIYYVPLVQSFVWIEFFQGDPDYPIWVGQFYPIGTKPTTKKVARVGDAVSVNVNLSGTDPQGGTVTISGTATGTITSVSSNLLING